MKLFEVFGVVNLDDKKTNKTLDELDKKGESVAKKFGKMAKTIGKVGLAAGTMGAVVGGAMLGVAKKTSEALDRVDKMSQKMGLSAKAFQEWDFITSQFGTSMETIRTGMKTFNMRIDELSTGAGVGSEAMERLGMSFEDIKNLSPEEQFEITISRLQEMENETQRNAIASDLFGRAGQELIPVLNAQGGSIDELKQKAHELGLVQSDEAVAAGAKFTDMLDQTTRMLKSVGTAIGVNVLPIMNKFLEWVQQNVPVWRETFRNVVENYIIPTMGKMKDIFNDVILPALDRFKTWLDTNMPIIQKWFKMVIEDYVIPIWNELYEVFNEFILPILGKLYGWVVEFMPIIKQTIKTAFDIINPIVKGLWTVLTEFVLPVLEKLFEFVDGKMPQIKETISTVLNTIQGIFENVFGVIDTVIQNTIGVIQNVIDTLESAIQKFNKFKNKAAEKAAQREESLDRGFVDVKGFRANGGPVKAGETYVVGEEGIPEYFVPDQNGTIFNQEQMSGMGGVTVQQMIVRKQSDIKEIARELFLLQKQTARGNGGI